MRRAKLECGLFVASFLAPTLLLYGLFVIVPLLQVLQLSLYRWRGVSQHRTFVGLENFHRLASDEIFFKAIKNSFLLIGICGPILILAGVAVAHLLNSESRISRFARAIYLFPQVISLVVVAVLWSFIYNPSFGLLDAVLKLIGMGNSIRPWLGDPATALPAVAVSFIWDALGFYGMLFAAGLKGIPEEIREAAELDGAVGLKRFWKVTWPLLWSIKKVASTYIVINVLNTFALVYLMTHGGPDRATDTLLTYLYEKGFSDFRFGDASAIGVANLVLALGMAGILALVFRKDPTEARR